MVVVILAIWLFTTLFLNWLQADKVVVLEGIAWMKALRRSKELMKGRTEPGFWKSIKTKASMIILVGFLIGIGIHLLFQLPGVLLGIVFPEGLRGHDRTGSPEHGGCLPCDSLHSDCDDPLLL